MATIGGQCHKLAKGKRSKREALSRFHELMATVAQAPESSDARAADICEAFLDWSSKHHAPDTYRGHSWYIQSFCEKYGYVAVLSLKPFHLTRWIDSKPWNTTSCYNAVRFVSRAFSWAKQEGLINVNPIEGVKKPKPRARQRAMTEQEFRSLLKATDGCFRVFLFSLRQTGARPKEVRELRWEDVRDDRWILWKHKTDRTGKPRVVYLNEPMQKLMRVLRRRSTSEYVFTNSRGVPWTRSAVTQRIMRLKKKLHLDDDVCAYLVRHAFGTGAIINGVDVATVAELMGHNSTEMVNRVYVHLADQHSHLQAAINHATRSRTA
jgi:integrase